MREFAERMSSAGDLRSIGEVSADACERLVPHGQFAYAVMEPRITTSPVLVIRSREFPPEYFARKFSENLYAIERDLGGLMNAISEPHAYDGYAKFPLEKYGNTETVQDHWRPARCDRQLIAPIWNGGSPVGYFVLVRSRMEPKFTAEDLRALEEVRLLAERSAQGVVALGQGGLTQTLDALAQAFPHPAFLFGPAGDLRWMSDEGALRLEVEAARLGGGLLVRGNAALEALARHARAIASDPSVEVETALRLEGVLRRGERLAVRTFGEGGTSRLLLALVPAMAKLPGEGKTHDARAVPGLGAVESRVARLAAEGFTILNIATQLGVSESTARTHLRRVYVKLGVHGRAELATALLKGGGGHA